MQCPTKRDQLIPQGVGELCLQRARHRGQRCRVAPASAAASRTDVTPALRSVC